MGNLSLTTPKGSIYSSSWHVCAIFGFSRLLFAPADALEGALFASAGLLVCHCDFEGMSKRWGKDNIG